MTEALEIIDTMLDYIRSGKIDMAQDYIDLIVKNHVRLEDDLVKIAITLCKGLIVVITGNNELALHYSQLVLKDLKSIPISRAKISIQVKAKNLQALSLFNMGRREEAFIKYNENLTLLQKNNDLKEDLGICLNNIGYYYLMRGQYSEARRYFEQAVSTLECEQHFKQRYKVLIWRFKENLVLTLIKQGNFNKALDLIQELLELAEKRKDLLGTVEALHDLGIIMREQGNFSEARNYFNKALLLARKIQNRRLESMILGDLGELCLKTGHVTEAHQYLLQSVELAQTIHNEEEIVRRLCQLSEVDDLLRHHDKAMERLNQASRMAQRHSSEEEIEYVKFAIASNYFRKGLLYMAAIFFTDVYNDSLRLNNSELLLNCRLYLSAIQISWYLESGAEVHLTGARDHLESFINHARKQQLVSHVLIGKILRSILHLFAFELEEAEKELEEAQGIASRAGNDQALRTVLNLKTILTYFVDSTSRGVKNVGELTELFMTHGSLTFLREFVFWTTVTYSPHLTSQNFADAFVIQEKFGPELYHISSSALDICKYDDLIRSTYALTAVFGQGSQYFEGLYGPIPITRSSIAMIYTKLLPDSKSPDARYEGKNYCIYMILFPFETRITVQVRECLEKILEVWFNSIVDVRTLTESWFSELRQELTNHCFSSPK